MGSARNNLLCLEHPEIAQRHAILYVRDGLIFVADRSQQSVWVNGEPVQQAQIGGADEIQLGDYSLKVELTDAEVEPPQPRRTSSKSADGAARTSSPDRAPAPRPPTADLQLDPAPRGGSLGSRPDAPVAPVARRNSVDAPPRSAAPTSVPGPRRAHVEDDHDEEDDERNFVPAFSLLMNVVRDPMRTPIAAEPTPALEVIAHKGGRLIDVALVTAGRKFRAEDLLAAMDVLRVSRTGRAEIFFTAESTGELERHGRTEPLSALATEDHLFHKKRAIYGVELSDGDVVRLRGKNCSYVIRPVRAPKTPPRDLRIQIGKEERNSFGAALVGMIVLLVGIWVHAVLFPTPSMAVEEEVEFADVSLKELGLEEPDPPKPPEPPKAPEPMPITATPPESPPEAPPVEPRPEPTKRPSRAARRAAAPKGARPAPSAAANALAALEGIRPVGTEKSLSDAVSNIAAVRVPSGTSRDLRLAGTIGKVAGSEVTLSTGVGGGGNGRDTRAAATLLAGKQVGALSGGGGGRGVRGVVERMPARTVNTSGGSLSREEILKVVNSGIGEVQRCYERQLMKSAGLQGKVVFDWIIAPNGSVESTRVRSSSLRNEEVAACIAQVIKRWSFPKPVGGSVKVTFPFVFSIQGF